MLKGCCWFLLTLILSTSVFGVQPLMVELKSEVDVATPDLYWGDVAVFKPAHPISSRRLAKTPKPGQSMKLYQQRIKSLLTAELENGEFTVVGNSFVLVRGAGKLLNKELINQKARTFLQQHIGTVVADDNAEVILKLLQSSQREVLIPDGVLSIQPRASSKVAGVKKRMNVLVDLHIDGEHFQTVPIWFSVNVTAPVWVAKQDIGKYSPWNHQQWEKVSRDIASGPLHAHIGPIHDNQVLSREIAVGEVLRQSDFQQGKMIHEGETVTALSSHGAVTIALKGEALDSGSKADVIRVRHPENKSVFRATVVNKGMVRVN